MATSSAFRRTWPAGVAAALLLAAGALSLVSAVPSSSGSRAAGAFSWVHGGGGRPPGWPSTTTASRSATLFYPPGWKPITGDRGTVSVAQRDSRGRYRAYLNVTPRQGTEALGGWAAFRIARNRGEGNREVSEVAAAEGLRLANARASCVVDDYLSRVGANPYRELACILAGRRHTDVFVGATLRPDWNGLRTTIERAASALIER